MALYKHILVPVDFGVAMQPAIDHALELARALDAKVTLLHAFDTTIFFTAGPYMPAIDIEPMLAGAESELKTLRDAVVAKWPKVDAVLKRGIAWEAILEGAKEQGCDLIVIGTHGRRGLSRLLLGSVAERVVRLSPVPVLSVRPSTTSANVASAA